jgi:hypothetical protein
MATLKDLFGKYNTSAINFRNNEKADANGVLWANAFVEDADSNLICIGATVDTLAKVQAKPDMPNLMLTTLEEKTSEKGRKYYMCQLAIATPADFTFSIK